MNKNQLTNKMLLDEAIKYDSPKALERGNRKAYRAIWYRGEEFVKLAYAHMENLSRKFTKDELADEAQKYTSRRGFELASNRHYQQAHKLDLMDKICMHMVSKFNSWDVDQIRASAAQCNTRSEFSQRFSQGYKMARFLGIYEEVCSHMEHGSPPRSHETVVIDANQCKSRKEFERRFPASYKAAQTRGNLDSVCRHMKLQHEVWSEEKIGIIAKSYLTRKAFEDNAPLAYDAARRWKIREAVCSHMVPGKGFEYDKSAYLYFAEVNNGEVYKVGVTNNSFERRFRDEKTPMKLLGQWHFETGREAFDVEQYVLKKHKHLKYQGKPVLSGSGNTELFSQNILLIVRNAIR